MITFELILKQKCVKPCK